MYDYLIVGSGLFGATFANRMTEAGKTCLVLEKRDHVGGNCYTEKVEEINVHKYGPHQFHTKSKRVWEYVNRFAEFNHYRSHIAAFYHGKLYSMPPNLRLFNQLWNVTTPEAAKRIIDHVRVPCENPQNFKEWVLDQVGNEIYKKFYEGYTIKQWGRRPEDLPCSTARRLPIRFTWEDRWFEDPYEGIPIGGYTQIFDAMLDKSDIVFEADYFSDREHWNSKAKKIVYTGKIDELFNYELGELDYRSLSFETETIEKENYQGSAIVNYTEFTTPYTRVVEHKHFEFIKGNKKTIVTKEFPKEYNRENNDIPYYPVKSKVGDYIYKKYQEMAKKSDIIVGGRLGTWSYMDMDTVIGQALVCADRELN